MKFSSGFGRRDITCFIPGMGMMGYGMPHNTVRDIATPLMARAMYLKHEGGSFLILIHLEMAFVSMAVKEAILELLQRHYPVTQDNLIVTAQHTHSAPGGFSHYPFYNFTIPHFRPIVVQTIAQGALDAVNEAQHSLVPCNLFLGEVSIHPDKEVAFNRSLAAHLSNPEVKQVKESELAVDRKMRGLLIKSPEGKLKAIINWFGVHCTSVSSLNHSIHHDNKGVAAELFERNHPGTCAFFLQSAAGDVSPNFFWDKKLKRMRGKFPDQYESAAYNGELQFRECEKIEALREVSGPLKSVHTFFDMRGAASDPAHGVAFFKGTLEGPGMPSCLAPVLSLLARTVKFFRLGLCPTRHQKFYHEQAPKDVMLDHRDGSFLGIPLWLVKKLPPLPDPILEAFRKNAKNNALNTLPWVPAIVPFQLIQMGQLLIATIPGEITTMAARRLEQRLEKSASPLGIREVIITSYANAYMGYITTPEEYASQSYEGGHTVYGRNSLHAIFSAFDQLIAQMQGSSSLSLLTPYVFPPDELARRSM